MTPPPDFPLGPGEDPDDDPFRGVPLFGDLARMLNQQMGRPGFGPRDTARQFAVQVATGGRSEPNVDPLVRIRLEELARVAELHVTRVTGLGVPTAGISLVEPVTRTRWVERTLDDYRDLLDVLASSLATAPDDDGPPDPGDPLAMFGPLMEMMGPMMVGLATGSMVGNLARRSFGQYDLPIPRPTREPVLVVAATVDEFAADWSLPADDVRLWVCIHELAHHAVLDVPHVRARLTELLNAYASGFDPGAADLSDRLGGIDPDQLGDPAAMAGLLGSPDVLLGALRSPAQEALLPDLEAAVAVVVGVVDHVMDTIGNGLLGDYAQLTEALRRRRVEASDADRFVERLLGLEMTQATYERGRRFVDGVAERAGAEAISRLWDEPRNLPTPAEVDAPGLWLARIDLPLD